MITGGFGMTMDLQRGTMRQWVMGRDGVKRWADNNEPVQAPLPDDIARCAGVGDPIDGWREGCEHCLRRTTPPGPTSPWIEPPAIVVFECEFLIEPGHAD